VHRIRVSLQRTHEEVARVDAEVRASRDLLRLESAGARRSALLEAVLSEARERSL